MSNIALISNCAPHYRAEIYTKIDRSLDVDFYFGECAWSVKKMDCGVLTNHVHEVHNVRLGPALWQTKIWRLAFKPYHIYIVTGEPRNISTWLLMFFCAISRKKVFLWTHGWYGRESKLKSIIKKAYFGLASGIMTYGEYARKLMIEEGFAPNKIVRLGNSLAYEKQLQIRQTMKKSDVYEKHFHNDNPTIIMIGRLNHRKKLELLIRSIKNLTNSGNPCNLVLVGNGEERDRLTQMVQDCGISDFVWFYGASYDEQVNAELLYNADLCVVPGYLGLTSIHAMMFGCPVVTHNDFSNHAPEFESIQPGQTGDFFKSGDEESLAQTINKWLKQNKNKREDIRTACYKEVDTNWTPYYQMQVIKKFVLKQKN